jgi:isopentenyl diphosphate isomerase/L-lactate dehydrogenase-like FMN-dependent dehydrogenase
MVGRPVVWGLACAGADGVRDVIEVLKAELATAMALTGCRDVESVTREIEWREPG